MPKLSILILLITINLFPQQFPLTVGNKWFYKYKSFSTHSDPLKNGFIVREIIDTTVNGSKTVSVKSYFNNGTSVTDEIEYWRYQNGLLFIDNTNTPISDPIFISSLKTDSSSWPSLWRILQNKYFDGDYKCQEYNYEVLQTNSGLQRKRIIAEGLGLVYLFNFNLFTRLNGIIDSTYIVGAIIDNKVLGDTANTILQVLPIDRAVTNFTLNQNYPNPFNPSTTISYQIPINSYVKLQVIDLLGREITTLVSSLELAGNYSIVFNGSIYNSGIYVCKLIAGKYVSTKKMVLLK